MLVCPIPSTYVETCSPVLGPAVLQYGNDVASRHIRICQGLTQKSGLRYTSSVWPWPGAPKVRIRTVQRIGLRQNPTIDWCGSRPIHGPGRGRAATLMRLHVMRLVASVFGSETHALRTEAACSCTCDPCDGVPGVVHTFAGVRTMGRVHRSVDGSL